jgi:beta-glucosidase
MKFFRIISFLFISIFGSCNADQILYKDASQPIDKRVEDLVKRMSLEEKAAQLQAHFINDTLIFENGSLVLEKEDKLKIQNGAGRVRSKSVYSKTPEWTVKSINALQKYLVEETRLGIPGLFFSEALHGFMREKGTSFPQAIALASTWDTVLIEKVFNKIALETRSRGSNQVLSTVLDLPRDLRWGRVEECYSEDPYLTSRMAMASIFGLQGRDSKIDENHVAVTLKHFAGHGQGEGGLNRAPVNYSEREFRETHLYPFEMAVKRANAHSVMSSYNEWDGVPNHVNYKLNTEIIRNEWGFKGYVMSDGGGLGLAHSQHGVAKDTADVTKLALQSGLDYDLSSKGYFGKVKELVESGKLDIKVLNKAVSNVLYVKFALGLFENPYVDVEKMQEVTYCDEHKALALKTAEEAIILLKNKDNILPLDVSKIKNMAIIGPNAADIHLGAYTPRPMVGVSVLDGMQKYAEGKFKVHYAKGCDITLNDDCHWLNNDRAILADPTENHKLIKDAVILAQKSDAVLLVIGENEMINREAWNETHLGDVDNLDLVGEQIELAKALIETGKPIIVLLLNGRPLSINYLAEHAPTLLEGWYLGQETGHAVARTIFGDNNPSGKLTITFPRSVGQLPCFYNRKPSRDRSYALVTSGPLFPFGFGLSYTNFEYSNLKLSKKEFFKSESIEVSVDITNTGEYLGKEIVQLYIHNLYGVPTRPILELKDFAKIELQAGEKQTVSFSLTPDKLEAYNMQMIKDVAKGEYAIMIGKNSVEFLTDTIMVK